METVELRERLVMGMRHIAAWWLGGLVAVAASASCGGKNLQVVGEMVGGQAGAGAEPGANEGGRSNGNGGKGGAPSMAGEGNGAVTAEAGHDNAGGSPERPLTGTVFYEGLSRVRGIAADATTLYWVEYGTEDSLGNFQNDGRLLARNFDSEDVQVLADDLPGAINVGLTSTHAYVYVDQLLEGGGPVSALTRMTLEGGDLEVVLMGAEPQDASGGVCLSCFVSAGSTGYFIEDDVVFRVAAEEATASVFLGAHVSSLAVSNDTLYYAHGDGVFRTPLDAANPVQISTQSRPRLQASVDFLYGLDWDGESVYLTRMPVEGGAWTRVERYEANYTWQLQLLDDLFFHDLHLHDSWQVVHGRLSDTPNAQVIVDLPDPSPYRAWVGTQVGVFWSDDVRVRHAPLAVP